MKSSPELYEISAFFITIVALTRGRAAFGVPTRTDAMMTVKVRPDEIHAEPWKNDPRPWTALPFLLAAGILVLYGRVVQFPFLHEDWDVVNFFSQHSIAASLAQIFNPRGKILFRPVSQSYLLLLYSVFGLNASAYHFGALLIHWITSLLVVRIFMELTSDAITAWGIGFLYGLALSIHIEPLTWCVGIYDVLGAFLFFLTIAVSLRGSWIALPLYALALFTKESCVVIPVILFILLRVRRTGTLREDLGAVLPFAVILALFAALKLYIASSMYIGRSGYAMAFTGKHIVNNIISYATWLTQALIPNAVIPWWGLCAMAAFLLLPAIAPRVHLRSIFYTLLWLALALAPVLFLTIRSSRYYAAYALAPFLWLVARSMRFVSVRRSLFLVLVIALVCYEGISSRQFLQQLAHGSVKVSGFWFGGAENLVRKGEIVRALKIGLYENYPELPRGAILVFDSTSPSVMASFRYATAPRLWYGDSTIEVYPRENLGRDSAGYFLYGSLKHLPKDKTILLTFRDGMLVREVR
jgi:hypothetical protein